MKKITENKHIKHLKGYLDALDDINGGQREFTTTIDMIKSKSSNAIQEIEFLSEGFKNLQIIKSEKYLESHYISFLLEKLILYKPFYGLYDLKNETIIPNTILEQYKKYVIFHLEDYIDFALLELYEKPIVIKGNSEILLLSNNEKVFIALVISVDKFRIILRFFGKDFSREQYLQWFNEVVEYNSSEQLKLPISKKMEDNEICKNGLTLKVNKEIIDPIFEIAKKRGFFSEDERKILGSYFKEEKIQKFEKVLFKKR